MCQMLKAELKKLSFIPYLILSISGIVLLCLSATGETDMSGKQISIFSLIFQAQQANTDISKSALALWQAGIGGWLVVFAPMLLSMGYILLLSEERRNGQIRFHILRSGNWKYCISKVCSGALAGGIVFLIGYALFGLLLVMRFPSDISYRRTGNIFAGKQYRDCHYEKADRSFFVWHVRKRVWSWCGDCVPGQVHVSLSAFYDQLYL